MPQRVYRVRKSAYAVIAATAWLIYLYLLLPGATFLAWMIGVRTAYVQLYVYNNPFDPFLLLSLPVIPLVCGVTLIGWAEYNRFRFSNADQRKRRKDPSIEQVEDKLHAEHELTEHLRHSRIAIVRLDGNADVIDITQNVVGRCRYRRASSFIITDWQ